MFQTFETGFSGTDGPARLTALRAEMKKEGVDGFIVPRADAHQGEYVTDADERLAWLTGFTGSAGFCAALTDMAGVFVDGRYRVQVKDQVADVFTPVDWPEVSLAAWLSERAVDRVIGFDPMLHTISEITELRSAAKGVSFRAVPNLIDRIWDDRPARPDAPFFAHPDDIAGETSASKRGRLAEQLRKDGHAAAVITLPDSIAWLLNIRGADIQCNPVPLSFAILNDDSTCDLFAPEGKTDGIRDHLGADVKILPYEGFIAAISNIDGPLRVDFGTCPEMVRITAEAAELELVNAGDPCVLPKARKNAAEIEGSRQAHLRDGAAVCRFLSWLDDNAIGSTEIDVVTRLEEARRDTNQLRDISFDTIAGTGPHGAVIHYRVTNATNRTLADGDLLVLDSGGQYADGTTDITRTIAVGSVGDEERACYTRVLQGMIAVSRARFPKGVTGGHLDALARQHLWAAGLDYDHGTGHGVGAYLCVHEGPARISRVSNIPLEPGMILSNEPGYYRPGAFGIRIENLIVVTEAPAIAGGDAHRKQLGFETLTYVPLDRRLIDATHLSKAERDWIDDYHRKVLDKIGPQLDGAAKDWLVRSCAPLPVTG